MTTITKSITNPITWNEIKEAITAGKAKALLAVGDIISVTLKDGTPMRIAVAGIDHYNENEVIFAFKDIMPNEKPMNAKGTNRGGYEASDMRTYLNEELFALLPDDLQDVIKERRSDKLWLFSRREVFGEDYADYRYKSPEDDKQLPYYKDTASRVKLRNGDTDWWWLASPSSANATYFCSVYCDGDSSNYPASSSFGVAPGFCI